MIHVFEEAGLGQAPFRFVGFFEDIGPKDLGNGVTTGAPGQPMGTCQFCGQGIKLCCSIESADGKRFIVGSTCVGKTDDSGLVKKLSEAQKERAADKREEKRFAAWQKALEIKAEIGQLLEREDVRTMLKAEKHPLDWRAAMGDTRLEWAQWMHDNARATGWTDVRRWILNRMERS